MTDQEKIDRLKHMILSILYCVDYTDGACAVTEMVGAVLPKDLIENAKESLSLTAEDPMNFS